MAIDSKSAGAGDPFNLSRFVMGQTGSYERALDEIRAGRKVSHWMWFIFPQFEGLGHSPTSHWYAIKSRKEAEAYLKHPVLGPRLLACVEAVLSVERKSARAIFGSPDDVKLRSCATLFAQVSSAGSEFEKLITKYFASRRDEPTIQLIESS